MFTIVFVLFGGIGTVAGPLIGALILYSMYNFIGISTPQYFQLFYGLLIIVLVLFLPDGVASILQKGKFMCHNGKQLLRVEGLEKKFGGFRALNGVNIDVCEEQIVGLAGPNGSGKTTLINVISGVYKPDGGSVEFDGKSIYRFPSHKIVHRGINRTFQVPKPLAGLTVWENVLLAAVYGSREGNKQETIREALSIVELYGVKDSISAGLTFAQQKLLGLATALATKPKLLLVDEIAAGLSHQELLWIAEMLLRIRTTGVAMIVVEHHLGFIDTLTSDVVVMNAGANLFRGSIQQAAQNEEVVEVFLGR